MQHVNVRVPAKFVPFYFPDKEMPISGTVAVPFDILLNRYIHLRGLENVTKILLKFNKRYGFIKTNIS